MPSIFIKTSQILNFSDLSPKKVQKVLRKIEEMADVFLILAHFAKPYIFDFNAILPIVIAEKIDFVNVDLHAFESFCLVLRK